MRHLITSAAAIALASLMASSAMAQTSVALTFNGTGNDLAATGFNGVYSLTPSGFSVGGGSLTINTLPGDTFGDFENDPDTADNMFYNTLDGGPGTVVEAAVRISNLNTNFHGGGIWMGTDQDHYVRLGLYHNSFEGGITAEMLRENQDLWAGNVPPGPGGDIVGANVAGFGATPQTTPLDVVFRLVRTGSTAQGFISVNGGAFQQIGGTFDNIVTGPGQGANGGTSIEGEFKVGVYAFGGPDGSSPAVYAFDSFTATVVPEPASLAALAMTGLMLRRRR